MQLEIWGALPISLCQNRQNRVDRFHRCYFSLFIGVEKREKRIPAHLYLIPVCGLKNQSIYIGQAHKPTAEHSESSSVVCAQGKIDAHFLLPIQQLPKSSHPFAVLYNTVPSTASQ